MTSKLVHVITGKKTFGGHIVMTTTTRYSVLGIIHIESFNQLKFYNLVYKVFFRDEKEAEQLLSRSLLSSNESDHSIWTNKLYIKKLLIV